MGAGQAVTLTNEQTRLIYLAGMESGLSRDEFGGIDPDYETNYYGVCFAVWADMSECDSRYSQWLVEVAKQDSELAAALATCVKSDTTIVGRFFYFPGYRLQEA